MAETIKIAVAGCSGRMGERLCALTEADRGLTLVGGFERPGVKALSVLRERYKKAIITDIAEEAIRESDVIIDFTVPEASIVHVKLAKKHKKKIVIGTTGFSSAQLAMIKRTAKDVPILLSPNMSLGVNLLFSLSRQVAALLSDEYDIEIVEAHHRDKKDAPSGTAMKLAQEVAEGRRVNLTKAGVWGRKGLTGARKKGTIGVHAIRGGDVVGDHVVSFMADGERIELGHKASSRDAFAKGALVASKFISKKRSGLFSMHDVLGI